MTRYRVIACPTRVFKAGNAKVASILGIQRQTAEEDMSADSSMKEL